MSNQQGRQPSKDEQMTVKELREKLGLYVRRALNPERVQFFRGLISTGQDVGAVKVAKGGTPYDARHRLEAMELEGVESARIERDPNLDDNDTVAMIHAGYKANFGGALPPTSGDIEHVVLLLLQNNTPLKKIVEVLGLGSKLGRQYIATVQSKQQRARNQEAAEAVRLHGLSVPKALELFPDVEEEDLKLLLGGRRKKKANQDDLLALTLLVKSTNQKVANILRRVLAQYADGEITQQAVEEVLKRAESLHKGGPKKLEEWKKRFEGIRSDKKKSAPAPKKS